MNLAVSYVFDAPAAQVWDLLMDPTAIATCLPGCGGLHTIGDDRYEVQLAVTVAAVSGDFKGTVALTDREPPQAYRLLVEVTGRPGFVKGEARVTLVPDGHSTTVQIAATATVGGLIARVGQRLLDGVVRVTTDRFFRCLANRVQAKS